MGKQSLAQKQEIVSSVEALLDKSQMIIAIDYTALTVGEMSDLRNQLYPTDSTCMVVKNTLMRRAITDKPEWEPLGQFLGGQSAFIAIEGDVAAAIKAYQAFQKGAKKSECRGAVMGGTAYDFDQVKAIGELPSKKCSSPKSPVPSTAWPRSWRLGSKKFLPLWPARSQLWKRSKKTRPEACDWHSLALLNL